MQANAHGRLGADALELRRIVIDALWPTSQMERCHYIDSDQFVGICPVCSGAVGARFHGTADQVTFTCHTNACTEMQIVERIRAMRHG